MDFMPGKKTSSMQWKGLTLEKSSIVLDVAA